MSLLTPRCYLRKCIHLKGVIQPDGTEATERPYCAAFPDGIPSFISYGNNLHLDPVKGDHGIQYEEEGSTVSNVWTDAAREAKKIRYHVAIHKSYFPKDRHPKCIGNSYVGHWHIYAHSPTEAVVAIWKKHGAKLLDLVKPSVKQISLHWGTKKIGELLGRQDPIVVWKQEKK